ncbi:MAG: hypothetical protein ACON4U_10655 [Myxococcota bacterium]
MITFRFIINMAMASPSHPILPNDEPIGLLTEGLWLSDAEEALEYRPFEAQVDGALQSEDGHTIVIQDGTAVSYTNLGCASSTIALEGFVHALAPTPEGFAGYILTEISASDNNWVLHQNLGGTASWPAIRQFSATKADLQSTELGWMILKLTTVGWTLEHSIIDGGPPTPYPIALSGHLTLLDATDTEALIQSRQIIQADKDEDGFVVGSELYHWDSDNGLSLLDTRTDGQYWTQGVLGHSHGIYVLTDQGLVQNHINGFIVENGDAACIWKNKSSDLMWVCRPTVGDSEYTFWQSNDGIQWTGRLSTSPQRSYDCPNEDASDVEESPSKGCQSMSEHHIPLAIMMVILLALTQRSNRDSGGFSSH